MTAPDTTRSFPPRAADEQALLDGWLDYYRATVLHKCAGLSPDQLVHRSCPPSTMSLIGLVRHLTEMERVYVHRLTKPDLPLHYVTSNSPDADFDDVTPPAADADLRIFADHCTRSRQVMAVLTLDASLRWTYLYLIKEYSRHLGHADLLRERIDGATGE
jgi:hypothetical protein